MSRSLVDRLCGVADEAADGLEQQLEAHSEFGWKYIELRSVDGTGIVDLSEVAFLRVEHSIHQTGIRVAALDTMIGSRGKTALTAVARDLEELKKAGDRAQRLGTVYLRIMSFPNDGLSPSEWERRSLDKLALLVEAAATLGVVLLHENCLGWASQGSIQTTRMMRQLNSPHLRLLFDVGNPVMYRQEGFEFLEAVAPWVEHIHVKDVAAAPDGKFAYANLGDGQARVEASLRFLLSAGYKGLFSIEPHQAFVPHLDFAAAPELRRSVYARNGLRLAELLRKLEKESAGEDR